MMEARNPVFNANGSIDLEIDHPSYGWIPFTAAPDDVESLGPTLYAQAIAGNFGEISPYVAPEPVVIVPSSCTRGQGRITLLETPHGESNKLFAFEAMLAAISDPTEKKRAEVEYERETWERGNAFLQQSWAALGGTEAELDALFILAVTK